MNEYVQFPDYIVRKWKEGVISNTHLSDLLRLELLIRYGGLWIDSTTYMTGTIPAYIDDSNFFVYRNGWMDMEMINMGSWLIFSKYTNNIILLETQSLDLLRKKLFGTSSEKRTLNIPGQLNFFNEAELEQDPEVAKAEDLETILPEKTAKKRKARATDAERFKGVPVEKKVSGTF